jgi:hypothetical protein
MKKGRRRMRREEKKKDILGEKMVNCRDVVDRPRIRISIRLPQTNQE